MKEKIIHVHIFDASKPNLFYKPKKSERSELHIYKCKNTEGCDAFKKGQCINVGNVFGEWCPNGTRSKSQSCTVRAKGHYDQIKSWEETYSDYLNSLKSAPKKITRVNGGWMMPYSHITQNSKVDFKSQGGFMANGCSFLTDDQMTKENMISIIENRPQAVMGGEIRSYQKESIPKFIFDFNAEYPELFNKLIGDYERAKEILNNMDFVGRKAFINTLKAGCEVKFTHTKMHWDGEKLFKEGSQMSCFDPLKDGEFESARFEYIPNDKATIKVTSNDQVCSETRFAD